MQDFEFEETYSDKDCKKIKDECLIAFKVYDQCRQQDCLTPAIIGPARFEGNTGCTLEGEVQTKGTPINPPNNAAGVTIVPSSIKVNQILIVSKSENQFKPGFYDVDLKVSIGYTVRLFDANGDPILLTCGYSQTADIPAANVFNKKVTLFGSIGSDVTIASDLFGGSSSSNSVIQMAPFVFVEAKAVALDAKIRYMTPCTTPDAPPTPNAVDVTIGLFIIIKLFRTVQLIVESKGFCKPEPCPSISPDPCEFFTSLDFPFNVFNPPQKEDFPHEV